MVTEDECLAALREVAERLGHSPSKGEYEELDLTPSASTILRHYGSWNDAKEEAGLETTEAKGGSEVAPKPDYVELPDGTDWVELSQDQRWHYRHREHNTQRTLKRRQRLRGWINEQKSERGCAHCGEDDPACLDLHHRDPDTKEMSVSTMITWGYGKEKLRGELEKCEVLCANCHRSDHYDPPEGLNWVNLDRDPSRLESQTIDDPERPADLSERQQAWVHTYKRQNGCSQCGETDPGSLDLHHADQQTKVLSVSQLIVWSATWRQLQDEIAKCEVLCANCHRRKHHDAPEKVDIEDF